MREDRVQKLSGILSGLDPRDESAASFEVVCHRLVFTLMAVYRKVNRMITRVKMKLPIPGVAEQRDQELAPPPRSSGVGEDSDEKNMIAERKMMASHPLHDLQGMYCLLEARTERRLVSFWRTEQVCVARLYQTDASMITIKSAAISTMKRTRPPPGPILLASSCEGLGVSQ